MWAAAYASRERASITTMSENPALRSTDKSQESVWKRSLRSITLAISPGSGAPYSRTAEISCAMIDPVPGGYSDFRSSKLEDQPRAEARNRGRSGGDGLGVSKKAPVWGATRTGRQAFICQRQGDIALTGANGSLGQGPVHDVTLRVAAADLP